MMACRRYPMKGIANFRDLGGYFCKGGVTKWGVFFRSTSLHKAVKEDLAIMEQVGISRILDLRYPQERKEMPDVPVKGAEWLGISLLGTIPVEKLQVNDKEEDTRTLINMYRQIIASSRTEIRDSVKAMIDAKGPALFHCAAGKDRTGILAMLLLGAVGVSQEDIIADYEISHHYIRSFTSDISGSHGSNMYKLLNEISEQWGSVAGFLMECGISMDELSLLIEKFVMPCEFNG
ncbi:tyrosine-protein phosphatase [Lacrimispora saccharolytica]|uniref:Protein tyrosine/serine phosphatase n=1 Tax=Lacrimispora saccharolytica (strain ATCC 35040 / DSM 2544 / NRCC 2533 / WM1) TaxID=610130 RepID=D9R4N1_LACSW|nr:tyrosine-protein phosphatase [Lacrimispora saccharolytica]ADL03215.1 protein tyrosine/serine phosphatase [[Clostridium] saccharolyticum WM1]QRV18605.1 tyrosine-protein phosphatase [Lacrimispora saccharolytica]